MSTVSYIRSILAFALLGFCTLALAQDDPEKPPKFTAKGYLKEMASFNFLGDSLLFQNLVHNRLNFVWYPTSEFTVYAELRTRLINGDLVRKIPDYSKFVDSNNDYWDLSANLIDTRTTLLTTMIDRLFIQWAHGNWEVKAGRQRINWGVNLAWNPNDWFNAYSFFDFDYEERPGSDALRISYYTGAASSVEVAAKLAKDVDHFVGAAMWKINKFNYDLQFLGGIAQGDIAMGTGWAGNLKGAGFKGEMTYFHRAVDTEFNQGYTNMFLGAVSMDYSFANSLYLNASVMYNSQGSAHPEIGFITVGLKPGTVRDLSPYTWSTFIQSAYQISPLFYSSLALIGYPGSDTFFVNPGLTISALQNLDIDLIGQLFYGKKQNGNFGSVLWAAYIRIKWSF
jgi:hypothetical protein